MEVLKASMAMILFGLGLTSFVSGLLIVLAREYQESMRTLSVHSVKISSKAITEEGVSQTIDAASRLVEAVAKLVQTAVGVGAFLCLLGLAVCVIGYWMLSSL